MNEQIHIDNEELFLEITRYLAAVDLYRTEQCGPTWRPEAPAFSSSDERLAASIEHAPSTH